MKKAVLISIRPEWCQKIASGEKTIEVRKNRPKLAPPFKCYIYCTRDKHLTFMQNQTGTNLIACMDAETAIPVGGFVGNGKVIGRSGPHIFHRATASRTARRRSRDGHAPETGRWTPWYPARGTRPGSWC